MRVENKCLVSAWILVLALGAGCGGSDNQTAELPVITAGKGAPGGSGGATSQPVAGTGLHPTAGAGAAGTAIAPPIAGRISTAGTGAAGTGTAGIGPTAGTGPTAGAGLTAGTGAAGATATAGTGGGAGTGTTGAGACCQGGDCLCHGDPPAAPTEAAGPFKTAQYDITTAGCVFYPMDADPPFAAVTISDGFGGSGGCTGAQTSQWGPLYASWGIVAMIIHTGASDEPNTRGMKLTAGIAAFKTENTKMGSPLMGKLSGRYGTSGFSMGGGGTTFSASADPTLKSNVAIMPWGPSTDVIKVPSLFIFGSSDTLAGTMGMAPYSSIPSGVDKMIVTINSGHAGQPTNGGGDSGKAGLAFQKVYLEGDDRWKPILLMLKATATTIM